MNAIKVKTLYNKEYLTEFCREKQITLTGDYANCRVNRRLCINAKCPENCGNDVSSDFRQFVRNNGFCNTCLYKKNKKIRYNKKYLLEYCKLNKIQLTKDYTSINISRDTIIFAKCLTDNCVHTVEKTIRGIVEHSGCYCEECTENTRINKMKTAEWDSDKTRFNNNFFISYCNDNSIQLVGDYANILVNRETVITAKCLTDNCAHTVEKTIRGIVEYGGCYCIGCISLNAHVKRKSTNMTKYGVEHPLQDPEIAQRAANNAYKSYDFRFHSGRVEKIQGYEHFMLNDLLHLFTFQTPIFNY